MQVTKRGICRACESSNVTFSDNNQRCDVCIEEGSPSILPSWDKTPKHHYLPTYGEEWTRWKSDAYSFDYSFDNVPPIREHNPRMSREQASKYYTDKINKEFKKLGCTRKPKVKFIPEPFQIPEQVRAVYKEAGFDSVDDYYDFHEALKHKNKIGMVA